MITPNSRTDLDNLQPWQMRARATGELDQAEAIEADVAAQLRWWNENVAQPRGLEPITLAEIQA